MAWEIEATQNEDAWFEDYIRDVIAHAPPDLPAHDQKIGRIETHWHQISPGVAFIASNPDVGRSDDRRLAEAMVLGQLLPHGFKRASWSLYWDHSDLTKVSVWGDIEAKARRLIQSGQVTLLRNGYNSILGQVQGDHGNYRTEIARDDPNSQSITGSHCQCDWGQFQNLPRTRQWKRFQNRPCAHILATYWQAAGTPIDEARAPGNYGEPGQMSLFDMGGSAPNTQTPMWQNNPMPDATQGWTPPQGMGQAGPGGAPMQAPAPEDVLPMFPMDDSMMPQVNPVSIPGGRPGPTPTNPIQYPGGTFSSIRVSDQQYQNGQLVRTLQEDVGTMVGRSEEHGAGQSITIPAGAICEVLGTDPATGMVNVLWMGKGFDQNSYFEPFGAVAWFWPSQLKPSANTPPGPAIRRT